jgi:phosphoribosyl 1,2-cyclic phosphodiesterase
MELKLWGVRGSIPAPEPSNMGYGGNTSCIEIRPSDGRLVIFDAGTGIRRLGAEIKRAQADGRLGPELEIDMFFTHFHYDHIQGLPFFAPLFDPKCKIRFYSSRYSSPLRESITGQMVAPYFPVTLEVAASRREFIVLEKDPVQVGALTVHPFQLNHPQGATGYRIESEGKAIVYATDREQNGGPLDAVVREYSQDADILIHDSQYTLEEFARFQGYGHSTWLESARVAWDSRVKQLLLFHHDPTHDDATVTGLVERAREEFENTIGAREGWTEVV